MSFQNKITHLEIRYSNRLLRYSFPFLFSVYLTRFTFELGKRVTPSTVKYD